LGSTQCNHAIRRRSLLCYDFICAYWIINNLIVSYIYKVIQYQINVSVDVKLFYVHIG